MMYAFRQAAPDCIEVTKFDDHRSEPEAYYEVLNSKCNCMGAHRKPYCTHREMIDDLKEWGIPFVGLFYDPENNRYWHLPFGLIDQEGKYREDVLAA